MVEMTDERRVELSLTKKYKKEIYGRFIRAINEYKLLQEGDRVAVCISGGKDSMLMARCFMQLQKHSDFPFELRFIVMDPGYAPENRRKIEENARFLGIPVDVFSSEIFEIVESVDGSPCYLCARMRRGYLYGRAEELGCNKIALGHHFDDVIETILMGMLYGAQVQTMMPKLRSSNFKGLELIRPMYLIRERDIIAWSRYLGLEFIRCACRFTAENDALDKESASKRKAVKALIAELEADNPLVPMNIFRSVENVNLQTIISYHSGEDYHTNIYEKY